MPWSFNRAVCGLFKEAEGAYKQSSLQKVQNEKALDLLSIDLLKDL